jgi:hypothetical protein
LQAVEVPPLAGLDRRRLLGSYALMKSAPRRQRLGTSGGRCPDEPMRIAWRRGLCEEVADTEATLEFSAPRYQQEATTEI